MRSGWRLYEKYDAILEVERGWPSLIKNTRHIGDFTEWTHHNSYQIAFERLLIDLKGEGK